MKDKACVACAAAFGGIAPNVFFLAATLTAVSEAASAPAWTTAYLFGLLILAAIGAAVALIFGEKEAKKAFFLGLGLPAFFQAAAANLAPPTLEPIAAEDAITETRPEAVNAGFHLFSTPAYAQATPVEPAIEPAVTASEAVPAAATSELQRSLKLYLPPKAPPAWVVFISSDRAEQRTVELAKVAERARDGAYLLAVPDFAATCRVRSEKVASNEVALESGRHSVTEVRIEIQDNSWSGFWQAVGARGSAPYKIDVKAIQRRAG